MSGVYTPDSVGVKAPSGGFQQGGWYGGRQYWGGTLSDPGVIHPSSNQVGAGQAVSAEVNAQSAAAQGKSPEEFNAYLTGQKQAAAKVVPQSTYNPSSPGGGMPGGAGADLTGFGETTQSSTINLPEMYKSLYAKSGVTELEAQYSTMEKEFIDAKSKVNDNPFLSEATRVGRIAKLEQLFNERTANIKNDIAIKKADVETQLNLQTKQYDINRQEYKDNLDRFNVLLSSGALDGASGEDLLNISRSTGISASMIQSIVAKAKKSDIKPQVITSTDDNGNVTFAVIDTNTGDVINKQSLGNIGKADNSGGLSATDKKITALKTDVQAGALLKDVMTKYTGSIPANTIFQVYNLNSPYGPAKESAADLQRNFGVSTYDVTPTGKLDANQMTQINTLKDYISQGYFTREAAIQQFPEYGPYL